MNIIIYKTFLSSDKLVYFYQPQNRRVEDMHMYRVHYRANKLAEPLSTRYPSRDPIKPQVAPTALELSQPPPKKENRHGWGSGRGFLLFLGGPARRICSDLVCYPFIPGIFHIPAPEVHASQPIDRPGHTTSPARPLPARSPPRHVNSSQFLGIQRCRLHLYHPIHTRYIPSNHAVGVACNT
jgi:hypothetical protein